MVGPFRCFAFLPAFVTGVGSFRQGKGLRLLTGADRQPWPGDFAGVASAAGGTEGAFAALTSDLSSDRRAEGAAGSDGSVRIH